jgi:1-aminocyclopropane-1-carboxylate deaminase/D-cysteine desulfhydrase-like pyridoxal-dependent ACC family enzyme
VTALEVLDRALAGHRVPLATLPTPLERGRCSPAAPACGSSDDLTGLGMGGNKARKLELLWRGAGHGADTLITVGAGQSNHCRMTAAAGARLGWPVHLVLGGDAHRAGRQPAPVEPVRRRAALAG